MRERVSTIIGKNPVILVAPHGADDINTDIIVEESAKLLNCFAVINRGFERSLDVDEENDKADCNKINHCKSDVVFDEFLKPILKFKDKIAQGSSKFNIQNNSTQHFPNFPNLTYGKYGSFNPVHIFYIHGCGNAIHKKANENVGLIIGYGLGTKKDSLTCDIWRKNLFVELYRHYLKNADVFEGRGGGKYAGRDSNNMNQYFRKHDFDIKVQSMQIEFPFDCRDNGVKAKATAISFATIVNNYCKQTHCNLEPDPKFI